MEEYNFDIIHQRGKLHTTTDALSRLPSNDVQETLVIMSVGCLPVYAPQNIRDCQLADSQVGPLLKADEKPQSVKDDLRWCNFGTNYL